MERQSVLVDHNPTPSHPLRNGEHQHHDCRSRDQSSQGTDVDLKITAPSNVYFGNTQSSTFVVDPGIRTNVATNVTSNATLDDNLSFTIQTESFGTGDGTWPK